MTHVDPVCGMEIEEADAVGTHDHNDTRYYFCAESCLERFRNHPEEFLSGVAPAAAPLDVPAGASVEYICPMDPGVLSDRPGACPICGMALEPRVITLDAGPNPELVDMTRRLWIALALAAPIFLGTMGDMVTGGRWLMERMRLANWAG